MVQMKVIEIASLWQKGWITLSTQLQIDDLREFSSPITQITKAAEKELGAFLSAVSQVSGYDEVERAADLWMANFETSDWINADEEHTCRQVTIQALAQLVAANRLARVTRAAKASEQHARFDGSRQ
jgi:hypothetical protein